MIDSAQWPAAAVELRAVDELLPYARNARTHSDEQIEQLKASIAEFGWTIPVLVDEGGVLIAGHGRVLAARQMGIAQVPAMTARGWTPAQIAAYRIADNQLATNAGWDELLLRGELSELAEMGFDLDLLGFDPDELSAVMDPEADPGGLGGGRAGALADQFGVPPFTVLNAREGWWQDRKRAWLSLGIESELGRGLPGDATASFKNQGDLNAIMDQPKARAGRAIPGGGTGANSAYLFKTGGGYEATEQRGQPRRKRKAAAVGA